MRRTSLLRWLCPGSAVGIVVAALVGLSAAAHAQSVKAGSDCESGVLDPGDAGLNVIVYRLCPGSLTIGFESSDVVEELSCRPGGEIRLWLLAGEPLCDRFPALARDQVHEVWRPLKGIGRATTAPVRQLLFCGVDAMSRATVIVPDARAALLETRSGDTRYEKVTRRLISDCVRPGA